MKTDSKQNRGYDYLSSRINSFLLKGYSSVWQRVAFHLLFWGIIFFLDFLITTFRWQGVDLGKNYIFLFTAKVPTIVFFYFFFYGVLIESIGLRFLFGCVIFYVITHWLHLFGLHIVLQDEELKNTNKALIRAFSDVRYFDFLTFNAVSANLYSMILGFFPIGVKFAYDLYRTSIQKQVLETESTKAELSYLRNQINPHFIFNTINNAYYYVFKKDKESGELLLKLADVIRYTIEETGEDLILLEKEITIVRQLLTIEEIRSSTHATISISETIETDISKIKILPLALVTLVENAIKHGVGTNSKRGFVECTLKVTEESIDFSVVNSINTQSVESSLGIGLTNLKRRLQLVYDKGYELNLQNEETQYKAHLRIRI